MRVGQIVIQKLLAAAVCAAGVYIVAQEMGYFADRLPLSVPENRFGAYLTGIGLIVAGLIALLPLLNLRRKTGTISFPGEHGDVLIHLDSVQANLNKVVGKRAEVKKSYVRVIPAPDKGGVRIAADVLLLKTPELGARELAERLRKFIAITASNMLGIEEITGVDLNVTGIVVDKGSVNAMVETETDAAPSRAKAEQSRPEPEARAATHRGDLILGASEPVAAAAGSAGFADLGGASEASEDVAQGIIAEPVESVPAGEDLPALSSWDVAEKNEPSSSDAVTESDIVTPLIEDPGAVETTSSDSQAGDDDSRDKTLLP